MRYVKADCAATSNVTVNSAPPSFDGYSTLTINTSRIFLPKQTTTSQNGIWIWQGTGNAMTRPTATTDQYKTAHVLDNATAIWVTNGNTLAGKVFGIDPAAVVTVDTTNHTYVEIALPTVQVRVASTANITVSNPGTSTIDGVTMAVGDLLLAKDQSTASENGFYIWQGSGTTMTRSPEPLVPNRAVGVSEGTVNAHAYLKIVTQGALTLGTTGLNFASQNLVVNVRDFGAKGDGVAADTPAIISAIAAVPAGGTVLFPEGTYKCQGFNIKKACTLEALGVATLQFPDQTSAPFTGHTDTAVQTAGADKAFILIDDGTSTATVPGLELAASVTLRNLKLQYVGPKIPSTPKVGDTINDGIFVRMAQGFKLLLDNCDVSGFGHNGLDVEAVNKNGTAIGPEIELRGCRFHHNGYAGCSLGGLGRASITACFADYNGRSSNSGLAMDIPPNPPNYNDIDGYGYTVRTSSASFVGCSTRSNYREQLDVHSMPGTLQILGHTSEFTGIEATTANAISLSDALPEVIIDGFIISGDGSAHVLGAAIAISADDTANVFPCTRTLKISTGIIRDAVFVHAIQVLMVDAESVTIDGVDLSNNPTPTTGESIYISQGGVLNTTRRGIPNNVVLRNINCTNVGPIRVDVGQLVDLDSISWRWTRNVPPAGAAIQVGAGIGGTKGAVGRVSIGKNVRVSAPSDVGSWLTTPFQNVGLALPTKFSYRAGDVINVRDPIPGNAYDYICRVAGTAEAVAASTGTTVITDVVLGGVTVISGATAAHVIAQVPDAACDKANIGDYVTLGGTTFGATFDLAVEVLEVTGVLFNVDVSAGNATISFATATFPGRTWMASALKPGMQIKVAGVTWGAGGATWVFVKTVSASAFTVDSTTLPQQSSANAILRANQLLIAKPANVAASNAALGFQAAQFDARGPAATSATPGVLSAQRAFEHDALIAVGGYRRRRLLAFNDPEVAVAALTSSVINLGSPLPAKSRIKRAEVKVTTAFGGGAIASCTVDVGASGGSSLLAARSLTAVGNFTGPLGTDAFGDFSSTQLTAKLTATGANLNALTAGAASVEVFYETFPDALIEATEQEACTLWIRADKVTTTSGGGDTLLVSSFIDKSGNGFNLTSTAPNKSPIYVPNAVNGKPGALFAWASNSNFSNMKSAVNVTSFLDSTQGNWALLIVFTPLSSPTSSATIYANTKVIGDDNGSGGYFGLHLKTSGGNVTVNAVDFDTSYKSVATATNAVLGAPQLVLLRAASGSLFTSRNGDAETSVACGAVNNGSAFTQALQLGDAAYPFSGYIHEVRFWKRSPPPAVLVDQKAAMNAFWGCY